MNLRRVSALDDELVKCLREAYQIFFESIKNRKRHRSGFGFVKADMAFKNPAVTLARQALQFVDQGLDNLCRVLLAACHIPRRYRSNIFFFARSLFMRCSSRSAVLAAAAKKTSWLRRLAMVFPLMNGWAITA